MGTPFAEMTRSDNSNAKKGPSNDFNAFNDFHESETVASILAEWMEFAGIDHIEGKVTRKNVQHIILWFPPPPPKKKKIV